MEASLEANQCVMIMNNLLSIVAQMSLEAAPQDAPRAQKPRRQRLSYLRTPRGKIVPRRLITLTHGMLRWIHLLVAPPLKMRLVSRCAPSQTLCAREARARTHQTSPLTVLTARSS